MEEIGIKQVAEMQEKTSLEMALELHDKCLDDFRHLKDSWSRPHVFYKPSDFDDIWIRHVGPLKESLARLSYVYTEQLTRSERFENRKIADTLAYLNLLLG